MHSTKNNIKNLKNVKETEVTLKSKKNKRLSVVLSTLKRLIFRRDNTDRAYESKELHNYNNIVNAKKVENNVVMRMYTMNR